MDFLLFHVYVKWNSFIKFITTTVPISSSFSFVSYSRCKGSKHQNKTKIMKCIFYYFIFRLSKTVSSSLLQRQFLFPCVSPSWVIQDSNNVSTKIIKCIFCNLIFRLSATVLSSLLQRQFLFPCFPPLSIIQVLEQFDYSQYLGKKTKNTFYYFIFRLSITVSSSLFRRQFLFPYLSPSWVIQVAEHT